MMNMRPFNQTNEQYGKTISEYIRTDRKRSYSEQGYSQHNQSDYMRTYILAAALLGGACFLFGFFIWHTGFWGEVICWVGIILFTAGVGYRIYAWAAMHFYVLRKARINSRVIETAHVTLYMHPNGEFRNFTEDMVRAGIVQPLDEPLGEPEQYPKDTYEQHMDRQVYNAKIMDKKTWPQIQEAFNKTASEARTMKNRHEGRLQRGETFDTRSWY